MTNPTETFLLDLLRKTKQPMSKEDILDAYDESCSHMTKRERRNAVAFFDWELRTAAWKLADNKVVEFDSEMRLKLKA